MKNLDTDKKLTLDKMTITVLNDPQTITGGNGNGEAATKTVRTITITTVTDPDTG